MHIWLGVDFHTTFSCRGKIENWRKRKILLPGHCRLKIKDFVARSLPFENGGSHYELIAIATDVEQDVNEGTDGIEHMWGNRNKKFIWAISKLFTISFFRICGHKDANVPLDEKPFGFPFDRNIGFDIHEQNETFGWAVVSHFKVIVVIYLQIGDQRHGSDSFLG